MIKHIKQRTSTDCGVASLAMFAGIPYEEALDLLFPKRVKENRTEFGVNHFRKAQAIKKLKLKVKHQYRDPFLPWQERIKSIADIKTKAYISLYDRDWDCGNGSDKERSYCHAIVWDADSQIIHDPAYSDPNFWNDKQVLNTVYGSIYTSVNVHYDYLFDSFYTLK